MDKLYIQYQDEAEREFTARLPGVQFLDIKVSAPQLTPSWLTIAGSDGQRLQTANFNANTVTISLMIKGKNMADFRLLRSLVQSKFYTRGLVRLRTSLDPAKVYWVLAQPSEIVPIQSSTGSVFDFIFINPSGMAQSLVKSDELPDNLDKLQIGMNLPIKPLSYIGRTNTFNIFNPSDVAIDPYIQHHDLKIIIKGTGEKFTLTNKTNGTSLTVNHQMKSADVFVLNGITPFYNGSTEIDTDYGHIELEQGNNDIQVSGLNNPNVTFSFPFLYFG